MKLLFFAGAAFCLVCAAVFGIVFLGYGMTALLFLFAAALCVFLGLCHGRKEKAVRRLRLCVLLCLAVGFCLFLAAEIPVLAGSRSDGDSTADYLILMGAGINGTEPSLALQSRLLSAYEWLEENPQGVAIASGGLGPGEVMTEAQCMFDWLTARGVAPERILLEEQATNSYENILYSLRLIEARGGDPAGPVAIVSGDYHLFRIRLLAESLGCEARCLSARSPYLILYINYAVREAFAVWEIWLFGSGH